MTVESNMTPSKKIRHLYAGHLKKDLSLTLIVRKKVSSSGQGHHGNYSRFLNLISLLKTKKS